MLEWFVYFTTQLAIVSFVADHSQNIFAKVWIIMNNCYLCGKF